MAVIHSSKIVELAQAADPKRALIDAIDGGFVPLGHNLLVATYIRPEKTSGGIIRPESNIKEDEFQGNVGLVVGVGDGFSVEEAKEMMHTWVVFGFNDGLRIRYGQVPCRLIYVDRIRATVEDPSKVL